MDAQPAGRTRAWVTLVPAEKDANGTSLLTPAPAIPTPGPGDAPPPPCPWFPSSWEGREPHRAGAGRPGRRGAQAPAPSGFGGEPLGAGGGRQGSYSIADLSLLSAQGWAWNTPIPTVRPPSTSSGARCQCARRDYYLTELKGAVRFTDVDFSYVPGSAS